MSVTDEDVMGGVSDESVENDDLSCVRQGKSKVVTASISSF